MLHIANALSRNPHEPAPAEGLAESETQVASVIRSMTRVSDTDVSDLLQMEAVPDLLSRLRTNANHKATERQWSTTSNHLPGARRIARESNTRKIVAQLARQHNLDCLLYFLDPNRRHKRAVLPVHLREKLIGDTHSGPLAGHLSTNLLFNTLSRTW